jgi:hypothetical protein
MNRRGFFASLAGLACAPVAAVLAKPEPIQTFRGAGNWMGPVRGPGYTIEVWAGGSGTEGAVSGGGGGGIPKVIGVHRTEGRHIIDVVLKRVGEDLEAGAYDLPIVKRKA